MENYITPEKLPLKNLDVVRIKGDPDKRIPDRYRVGDKTVTGITLGDAPVGLGNQGVEKRGRFTLPGTNKAIHKILDSGKKSGGSNPYAWDKDDIHPIDRLIGITPKDLENAETNRTFQALQELYKNKRFAGEKLKVYWGDTEESVKERIEMMKSVSKNRDSEPSRVQDDLENARMLGEAQNNSIRALNTSNSNEAFLKNRFFLENEQNENQRAIDNQRHEERTNREERIRETENLRYEERLRNELRRERAELERDERRDNFMIRQYEDTQDRLDRAEKREEREALQEVMRSVGSAFGAIF